MLKNGLTIAKISIGASEHRRKARWRSGDAADCKSTFAWPHTSHFSTIHRLFATWRSAALRVRLLKLLIRLQVKLPLTLMTHFRAFQPHSSENNVAGQGSAWGIRKTL